MNKLVFALIFALSSGHAIASDATIWGGDLDGSFEHLNFDGMSTTVRKSEPVDLNTAYSDLDGDIDEHVFVSDTAVKFGYEMIDPAEAYADLDGNSDLLDDV